MRAERFIRRKDRRRISTIAIWRGGDRSETDRLSPSIYQLITLHRLIARPSPLQEIKRPWRICARRPLGEICFCPQRRQLLGDGDVDELV